MFLANRPGQARADSTGLPLPGYECRLVDREGHTIEEAGRQGVLLVRGPGLSPGYWRASEEQQARFAGGWYRTGDLFRARRVGCPTVTVGGKTIVQGEWPLGGADPGRAGDLPSSAGSERGGSGSYLPAATVCVRPLFVTLATRWTTTRSCWQRIDQHLAEQIPSHMLPSQLHVLPACRATDNGKLARADCATWPTPLYHDNLPEERAC